mmetsp:Transcript_26318/g.41306  ORF Transcript_26318/g.41306 Transcript_26318/m.41306 type:complete len:358 (+) Transcript_26318:206-1279(+)
MSTNNSEMDSSDNDNNDTPKCCASCGITNFHHNEVVKLKTCVACKSVQYCSISCQKDHRPQHKQFCKLRAAEIYNEKLFQQPDSTYEGDCPICFLPIPIDPEESTRMFCCLKLICNGCQYAYEKREAEEATASSCPFCRQPRSFPQKDDVVETDLLKRIEVNDAVAMREMGIKRYHEGNLDDALHYWKRGAKLGDARAHYQLSWMYHDLNGDVHPGVEKDVQRGVYHMKEAAIGGHPEARYNLGIYEYREGKRVKAVKHWIIAANLGNVESMEVLERCFALGEISEEDFVSALRAHRAAIDATRSPQRLLAKESLRNVLDSNTDTDFSWCCWQHVTLAFLAILFCERFWAMITSVMS